MKIAVDKTYVIELSAEEKQALQAALGTIQGAFEDGGIKPATYDFVDALVETLRKS